jgi:hypothetical protein
VTLEILHCPLVLFGRGACLEGAKVAALPGFWIDLPRIEAIARLQLADHLESINAPMASIFVNDVDTAKVPNLAAFEGFQWSLALSH